VDADYIVVGTGSAGSVVANRLSADPAVSVVVLEAGPRDKDKFIHIPAAFAKLFRSDMDWDYSTEPQKELDGREIYWPRGKVLGGSSSMNAMMWVRGFPADYDEWAEHAGDQWDYANVEKYFNRIENGPFGHLGAAQPAHIDRRLAGRCARMRSRRVLRSPRHAAQGSAVEHRRRVSQTGAAAKEPDAAHRGHRDAGGIRRKPCSRCGIRATRRPPRRQGAA
jgi:choline dehydrogenase-like flavoprotein